MPCMWWIEHDKIIIICQVISLETMNKIWQSFVRNVVRKNQYYSEGLFNAIIVIGYSAQNAQRNLNILIILVKSNI